MKPRTQYDVAMISARLAIDLGFVPKTDLEFLQAAHGQASGLFGSAFQAADYGQKTAWIDMCERALREAAALPAAS